MNRELNGIICPAVVAGGLLFSLLGTAALAGGCGLSVQHVWFESYTARAETAENCSDTDLTLRVRNRMGTVVYQSRHHIPDLFGFADVDTAADMEDALKEWISRYPVTATTDRLPVWREESAVPDHREFPFYVREGMSRDYYEQIRQEKRRLHCFVQGSESLLCLTPDDSGTGLEVVGIQSFPG